MIFVQEALAAIRSNAILISAVNVPLREAAGLVLANDVFAKVSVPSFHQSSVDGYAFRYEDLLQSKEFTLIGEIAAGDKNHFGVQPQQSIRIFTGAPVPEGLDTVVMQEKTERRGNKVIVNDDELEAGSNVRKAGMDIKKDALALSKGNVLTPAAIGFLAGVGITEVDVYPKPVVHIIVTGKELQNPGKPLQQGQVYESNGIMLQTALEQLHISNIQITSAGDDVAEIAAALSAALEKADLVLLTGGVSVGDYDFVIEATKKCGVQLLFHKVAQRPGKPLYAGKKNNTIVFGLPGNPASVLSCFYNYVIVAVEGLTGRTNILQRRQLPLLADFSKKITLRQFLKAVCTDEGVMPLSGQESFRLSSFSVANCLIILPEEAKEYAAGDIVEILLLPYL